MSGEKLIDSLRITDEMSGYEIIPVNEVDTKRLMEGELVFIPTVSGSRYLLEVTDSDNLHLHGNLSRRGNPRTFREGSYTMTDVDDAPVKIYHDQGIKPGNRIFISSKDQSLLPEIIHLSGIVEGLQILRPTI